MSDFTFAALSPDTILAALEQCGIYPQSGLLALNSYENRVYQFISDEQQRFVVKFYRPQRWSDEQILEEHQFSQELADAEIPIVAPCLHNGQSLHYAQQYRFALFPSAGGRQFELDNLDHLEWMGRFIGRMHKVAGSNPFAHRPTLNTESFLTQPRNTLEHSELLPDGLKNAFFTILDQVISLTKTLYKPKKTIRLHGDCHAGNILWRDGPMFVDMDDCRMGPAVQDLWMMLSGDRPQQLLQLETMLEAYEEFCDFDNRELALIEPLRAMRMVHYMAWLSDRWQDPAFPRAFPWFGELKYWEQQVLALKEQLSVLQEPPLSLTPQY
ncbi:serine/threonine protein kinase [Aestuariibacter sp. GS-14]|uniref:serine/threonine protein kinase n=1 Tax=Alteromonadaceae TaxID=72275 RepID=UPI001128EA89|nr:serine/threonine protein kinase [Aestuariibacter sp. GS-14]TPV57868.1 serine/threonine protein kinase [Aestuariibacter sp. GS-14]